MVVCCGRVGVVCSARDRVVRSARESSLIRLLWERAHTLCATDLGNKGQCKDFFVSNGKWAASLDALWFIKAADGSTGRHISLMRRCQQKKKSKKKALSRQVCVWAGHELSGG